MRQGMPRYLVSVHPVSEEEIRIRVWKGWWGGPSRGGETRLVHEARWARPTAGSELELIRLALIEAADALVERGR